MIVVDTSALVAILRKEEDAVRYANALADAERCLMSTVSRLEAAMVLVGRGVAESADVLDRLVQEAGIEVVPFDDIQASLARHAFYRYGKGRHPASLNMGDCVSYALARAWRSPLLFKGNDFSRTDIVSALP
ncbi:type II toxin-antitoxin system VapC family toxin [Azospirillum sp.]|uniref:type II toxin-antitoxin system VapC family toxin n=1 Tax=Azospirillum sp. TaxID=34012 RepID=UPI002D625DFE|nr:type II toxin-antitoxin system VapC family toxin [Azospirillum sp.]HYD66228.1 type II toxin-antitoxin system VapC family toxin [Azospirillum sp.]